MLPIQYIGLLNTDRQRKGPVQIFLQGQGSPERYVLDRLPPWIASMLGHAKETFVDMRYISGVNLALCNPETREAMYQSPGRGRIQSPSDEWECGVCRGKPGLYPVSPVPLLPGLKMPLAA